jgi:hypothetical protein
MSGMVMLFAVISHIPKSYELRATSCKLVFFVEKSDFPMGEISKCAVKNEFFYFGKSTSRLTPRRAWS